MPRAPPDVRPRPGARRPPPGCAVAHQRPPRPARPERDSPSGGPRTPASPTDAPRPAASPGHPLPPSRRPPPPPPPGPPPPRRRRRSARARRREPPAGPVPGPAPVRPGPPLASARSRRPPGRAVRRQRSRPRAPAPEQGFSERQVAVHRPGPVRTADRFGHAPGSQRPPAARRRRLRHAGRSGPTHRRAIQVALLDRLRARRRRGVPADGPR